MYKKYETNQVHYELEYLAFLGLIFAAGDIIGIVYCCIQIRVSERTHVNVASHCYPSLVSDTVVTRCYFANNLIDILSTVNKLSLIVVDFRFCVSL